MNEFDLLVDMHKHNRRQGQSKEAIKLIANDRFEFETSKIFAR
jgi:hypothetical protein